MIKYLIFCSVFMGFTTSNNYLKYSETVNEAVYATHKKDFSKADSLYEIAFEMVDEPFIGDYNGAIFNALKLENFDKAFSYLKTAINFGLSKEMIEIKSWFPQIENRVEWFLLEKELPALWEKYEARFDENLRAEIMEIFNRDQACRLYNAPNFDANNLARLKKIVEKHGYPGYDLIGQDIPVHIILHHFSPQENEKYFYKSLKKALENGNITPFHYAGIIDYDNRKSNKLMTYGTYFAQVNGVRYLQPVKNFDKVNEVRKSIGLQPIEQFMEIHEIFIDHNFIGF